MVFGASSACRQLEKVRFRHRALWDVASPSHGPCKCIVRRYFEGQSIKRKKDSKQIGHWNWRARHHRRLETETLTTAIQFSTTEVGKGSFRKCLHLHFELLKEEPKHLKP